MINNISKRIIWIAGGVFLLVVTLFTFNGIGEEVGAGEIVVIQAPFTGTLHIYKNPGWAGQWWGKVTHYPKRKQFWFSKYKDQGNDKDQSIKVRFADGGHAQLSGSLSWEMPSDDKGIIAVHMKYGSEEAIEQQLVRTVIEKSVYMTGPLMTSKESYAERRNDLISFIEDQALHGVFKTRQKEVKGIDPITGQEKTFTVVEIQRGDDNGYLREEISPIELYRLHLMNLSINSIDYDNNVESQIQKQQELVMQVQTSIANAKKAEQDAITIAKQGEADATKAKWEQEVIRSQQITEAQQKRDVAKLEMEAAEFTKQKEIKLGEGEATRKRLAQQSNGSLEQKLDALKNINAVWADAFSKYQGSVVPQIQTGSTGSGGNAAQNFMEMINLKAMRDLGLDLKSGSTAARQ